MCNYHVDIPKEEEENVLEEKLLAHNAACKPFEQESPYIQIHRCIRDDDGNLLGGILAYSVMWHILYIDTLWVDASCRGRGIGRALLEAVEAEAKKLGCSIAHLDSFDFQGKDFYQRLGYTVFGVLEDCPQGHCEYFLCKKL